MITVTASDSQQVSASATITIFRSGGFASAPTPVQLDITYPSGAGSFTTAQAQITFRGTASHSSGIQSVRWSSERGAAGQAFGTSTWDTGPITLQSGVNNMTIAATATDGTKATRLVQVTYAAPTTQDTTAPTIVITSPNSFMPVTATDSIVLSGTASDNVGVTEVTWFTSTGASGQAQGTTSWTTAPIPLPRGYTSIVVRAFDAAGNVGWRTIMVARL